MKKTQSQSGFALLMTIIVVGAVLSIGLSLLDLTEKQVKLSTNAKQSELSFHAANAGSECAQYWRRASSTEMETGLTISPVCFNTIPETVTHSTISNDADGQVHQYHYNFNWGSSINSARCTEINTLVIASTPTGAGVTTVNMETLIPDYPDGNSKYCEPGARCTVISVKGYNRPCNTISGYGVVQREVLLQF